MDAQLQQRLAYMFEAFEQAMRKEDVPSEMAERVMNRVVFGDPRGDRYREAMAQQQIDPRTVQDIIKDLPAGTIVTPETGM